MCEIRSLSFKIGGRRGSKLGRRRMESIKSNKPSAPKPFYIFSLETRQMEEGLVIINHRLADLINITAVSSSSLFRINYFWLYKSRSLLCSLKLLIILDHLYGVLLITLRSLTSSEVMDLSRI